MFPIVFSKDNTRDWFKKYEKDHHKQLAKYVNAIAKKLNSIFVIGSLLAVTMFNVGVRIGLFLKPVPKALYLNVSSKSNNCPWLRFLAVIIA